MRPRYCQKETAKICHSLFFAVLIPTYWQSKFLASFLRHNADSILPIRIYFVLHYNMFLMKELLSLIEYWHDEFFPKQPHCRVRDSAEPDPFACMMNHAPRPR